MVKSWRFLSIFTMIHHQLERSSRRFSSSCFTRPVPGGGAWNARAHSPTAAERLNGLQKKKRPKLQQRSAVGTKSEAEGQDLDEIHEHKKDPTSGRIEKKYA